MATPAQDRVYHLVRFHDGVEADAFVNALQRFLDGPRGEAWTTKFHVTEVWAPQPLAERPLELYLSDTALMATETAMAPGPVPVVAAVRGTDMPSDCVLVMKGAELQ